MTNNQIDITIVTQDFCDNNLTLNLTGFIIQHNEKKYIITTHHNLPIKHIIADGEIRHPYINSCWNELLIINTNENDILKYTTYESVQLKIPKINTILTMNKILLKVIDYECLYFDNQKNSPVIPYIKCSLINFKSIELAGLSGSPVMFDNKIIGIFSKCNLELGYCYILPIYIAIKNLEKKDNNNIYTISNLSDIRKINNFLISDMQIYHSKLKINIPLQSYLLLECDIDNKITIQTKTYNIREMHTELYNKLYLPGTIDIRTKDNKYELTSRFMTLLNKIGMSVNILSHIFLQIDKIKTLNKTSELWLQINDKKIKVISD
jgi:hypothetical protein